VCESDEWRSGVIPQAMSRVEQPAVYHRTYEEHVPTTKAASAFAVLNVSRRCRSALLTLPPASSGAGGPREGERRLSRDASTRDWTSCVRESECAPPLLAHTP